MISGENKANVGDFWNAQADFTQAIALDPHCAQAYAARCIAKLNSSDPGLMNSALADAVVAYQLDHRHATLLANISVMRGSLTYNAAKNALNDCQSTLKLEPGNTQALLKRDTLLKNDFHAAIVDCTAALALDSQNAEAYETRGSARKETGEFAGAVLDLTRAIELGRTSSWIYQTRAEAEKSLGNLTSAKADFDQAGELRMSEPEHAADDIDAPAIDQSSGNKDTPPLKYLSGTQ